MKRINRFLLSGALLGFFGWAPPGLAGAETPRFDQRQANQDRRINVGEASGALTNREANRLEHQQMRIERQEEAA